MRKPGRLAPLAAVIAAVSVLALSGDLSSAHAAADPKIDKNYDLSSLDIFRKTIVQIKDNYVDPSRIDPKEMFTASLEAVERQVAEVIVKVGGPPTSTITSATCRSTASSDAVNISLGLMREGST